MDIGLGITSANALISMVKGAKAANKALNDAEFSAFTSELLANAADLKLELVNYKQQLAKLTDENNQLKKVADMNLQFVKFAYFENGDETTSPYCPNCQDADQKAIHLTLRRVGASHTCPSCENHFFSTPREAPTKVSYS